MVRSSYLLLLFLPLILAGCDGADVSKGALTSLTLSGGGGTFYPTFDPNVHNYAADCGEGGPVTLTVGSNIARSQILINGEVAGFGGATKTLAGLSSDKDLLVELVIGARRDSYAIHCLPADLPTIDVLSKQDGVSEDLLLISPRFSENGQPVTYLLVVDNNGVPHYRRKVTTAVTNFQRHADGSYSYISRTGRNAFGFFDNEVVLLNENLEEVRRVTAVGLTQTDNHDFLITDEGNYLFMSYDSSRRDLSAFGLAVDEPTRDSVIQEVTPTGAIVFEWNSWDYLNIADCQIHRFPDDYAHLNSLQLTREGDIVGSFRGCAQILKIDRPTGQVIWQLGGTDSDFTIVGDSFEEFCGQHAAAELADGTVVMFDNGGHCLGQRETLYGQFSRGLQYRLDGPAGQASFVRDHSLFGTYQEYTASGGSISVLANDSWLINWGRGPDMSLTEVASDGTVLFEMRITKDGQIARTYRAYREANLTLPLNLP
jgi:hypothetical protein